MPNIPFPNVPQVPGVPQVARAVGGSVTDNIIPIGAIASLLWGAIQNDTQWGIFDAQGRPLVNVDLFTELLGLVGIGQTLSTNSVGYAKETKVSDFPVESGGFASYNKVEMPGVASVILCFAGSESERGDFLNTLDAACLSTDLYSVVTPEVTYINFNIETYNYERRSTNGATLLTVELRLKEIRQVSAQYSTTPVNDPKSPSAQRQSDSGKVQPKAVEQSVFKKLTGGL